MQVAKLISYIFHPGIMPTLIIAIVLNLDTYFRFSIPNDLKNFVLGLILVNTLVFPALILVLLKSRNSIESFHLEKRKDRIIPFGVSTIFFFFTYNVLHKTSLPPVVLSIFLGVTVSIVLVFITSFFHKTSVHMVGISGVLAALLCLYINFSANYSLEITSAVIVWGVVGYARLKLKKHSTLEVYSGAFLGFVSVFSIAYFGITI